MPSTITITGKTLGQKKPLFADWSMPYPPGLRAEGDHVTLRSLITRTVQAEVAAFRKRQDERQFLRVLTARQIDERARHGKIDMGGRALHQEVNEDQSVAAALQGFEDGLYLVVVDEEQCRDLDAEVYLKPDSRVTFVRLAMLAGG